MTSDLDELARLAARANQVVEIAGTVESRVYGECSTVFNVESGDGKKTEVFASMIKTEGYLDALSAEDGVSVVCKARFDLGDYVADEIEVVLSLIHI